MTVTILVGDVREMLRTLPADSVHCVVTSPPYWGLRDYGVDGQIGLESSPAEFIATMVEVFEEVRRVLRPDGTCWMNMGDSYANDGKWGGSTGGKHVKALHGDTSIGRGKKTTGLKPKDLCMMPHRLAIALQDAGWWVRQDIVWHKPNPMPESIKDRCTKAHEYIFLLAKSERYYFDQDAIAEPVTASTIDRLSQPNLEQQQGSSRVPGKTNGNMKAVGNGVGWGHGTDAEGRNRGRIKSSGNKERKPGAARGCPEGTGSNVCGSVPWEGVTRNKRSVWTITTQPFKEAHFATFPPELAEICIKAGCPAGGVVLDPFFGAGTTGLVADRLQRDCVGIELNPAYAEIARKRIHDDSTLFSDVQVAA